MAFAPSSKPIEEQVIREVAILQRQVARLTELVHARSLPDPYRWTVIEGDIVVINTVTMATTTVGAAP